MLRLVPTLVLTAVLSTFLSACAADVLHEGPAPIAPAAPFAPEAAPLAPQTPRAPSAPSLPQVHRLPAIDLDAQAAAAVSALPVRHGDGRLDFQEVVLENGLRVVSLEDTSAPIAAVQLWYHVGSKDEKPDRQGFAHMFEHMMFRGTDRLGPKSHFDFIHGAGGNANAYTAFDQTVYVQELPSNQLEGVLWLEAERMAHLKIDEGGFATERKVVEEERRLGLNAPYGDVLEKLLEGLFIEHPYRWSPIGKIEHLRASTPQDIQEFWDTYYVPNNATLVVVGDVPHERVRMLAQKCFGWIPRCPEPPRVTVVEPEQIELATLSIKPENGPVPIAGIAFQAPPDGHPDAVGLGMLMSILGGGESSRVYLDLVRRKEIAVLGMGLYAGLEDAGFAALVGVTNPFGSTGPVIDALWEQVELVKAEGVTDEELAKVRKQTVLADVTEMLTIGSKANALGQAAVLFGDTQEANERIRRMQSVTAADLQRIAQTYLVEPRATEVTIKPGLMSALRTVLSVAGGAESEDGADEPEEEIEGGARAVATGPKAAAREPVGYPDEVPVAAALDPDVDISGQTRMLDNGLKVVVVENHEVPFVSMSLRLGVGAYTEDPAFPGTASMAASMITRGTVARGAEKLAAELERHGISLNASAGHESVNVSSSCLTEDVERAMRLMAEVIMVPKFDDKEFATLRDQISTGMAIAEKDPSTIADRTFDKALWGEHPYGRPADGTSEDLKKLTPAGLRDWWERFVRPDNAVLYVAGDLDVEQALAIAERRLGVWDAEGEPIDVPLPAFHPPEATRITLVDKPGAIQSEIRAGHGGITRSNPLYAAGVVLSQVLGGSFGSRLNDSLRIEKGLTYGARGGLQSRRFGGSFQASTFTKTPTTAETVVALIDEVRRMRDEAPSDKELRTSVNYIAGSFAGSLETPQAIASRLWTLESNGLPDGWWNDYLGRISSMSSADVSAAARDLLDPDALHIVVVGDASEVKESLEQIAPVDVVTEGG